MNLNHVQKLMSHHANLMSMPDLPEGLRVLSVFDNQITDLSDSLWSQNQLQVLNISANRIQFISPQLGKLTALRMIDMGSNAVREIPETIGSLQNFY